jgi:hypothetical protein
VYEVIYENVESIKGITEYSYQFWLKFDRKTIRTTSGGYYAISRLTINKNHQNFVSQGDRTLMISWNKNLKKFQFLTYTTNLNVNN